MTEMTYDLPKSPVYVQTDVRGRITRCEGGYSIGNCQIDVDTGEVDQWGRPVTRKEIAHGWTLIDEGYGDEYNLCQSHYFPGGLYTDDGIPRFALIEDEGSIYGYAAVLRDDADIEADRAAIPTPPPTAEEQLRADIDYLSIMTGVAL